MDGRTDGRMDGRTDGKQTDGQTDGWRTNGWTDGRMDGRSFSPFYRTSSPVRAAAQKLGDCLAHFISWDNCEVEHENV